MQKGILNGIKSLNWEFWKGFHKNPVGYAGIAFYVIVVFVYDLLFEILVPPRIKKEREAQFAEITRAEDERDKREQEEKKGADSK
jgi:hypothetical protein